MINQMKLHCTSSDSDC